MSYVLNKKNVVDLIHEAIIGDAIDDDDHYKDFIQDISSVITKHFGGEISNIEASSPADGQFGIIVHIDRNVDIAEGPTIYDKYDPDSDEAEASREFERKLHKKDQID